MNMTCREFFSLLKLNILVSLRNMAEFMRVACRYYSSWTFFKEDLSLRLMYLFHNPFSISRRFLQKRGEPDVYAYGETPLTSLEKIAKEAQITSKDCVYELGAGRGATCFWLHQFIGCSVVGIEYVPEFVERAERIRRRLKVKGIEFRLADMLKTDFKGATVCYLYGTCLDEHAIKLLIQKFKKLPVGTKIITVSYPLTDYTADPCFHIMKRFSVPFTWGSADVYLHVIEFPS